MTPKESRKHSNRDGFVFYRGIRHVGMKQDSKKKVLKSFELSRYFRRHQFRLRWVCKTIIGVTLTIKRGRHTVLSYTHIPVRIDRNTITRRQGEQRWYDNSIIRESRTETKGSVFCRKQEDPLGSRIKTPYYMYKSFAHELLTHELLLLLL